MTTLLAAVLLLPLAQTAAPSAPGDPQAGKTLWEGPATQCRNCHGTGGEGAFGPDLAGRKLTVAQFRQAVRKPWGIMPAYVESQVSDREVADLVAYFDSLPSVAQPGPWRFEVHANAPHGQQVALAAVGCAQCHGPTLNGPRQHMGAVGADFAWLRSMVYDHTTTMPPYWQRIGETPAVRVRMGNYSPARLPESLLQDVFAFARDLGFRPLIQGRFGAAVPVANGVSYTLDIQNLGLPDKGLSAEDVTVAVALPSGADVVTTTGTGYQGVRADADLKANTAVWRVPRLRPKDRQSFTITLSKAGTAADNVRGVIRWTKPAVKTGPMDSANIAAAPIAQGTR